MHTISAEARSRANRERVWELLATTATWASWAPFDEAVLEQEGAPEAEGVGAVRRFRVGRRVTRERVVTFEPPEHLAYELVSGIPIRDYRADVTLHPAGEGGTVISWESRFRGKFPVPGAVVRGALEGFVRRTADALARAAERDPAG
jgi:uncharacterized protein YndB with AHSA1/START domain